MHIRLVSEISNHPWSIYRFNGKQGFPGQGSDSVNQVVFTDSILALLFVHIYAFPELLNRFENNHQVRRETPFPMVGMDRCLC